MPKLVKIQTQHQLHSDLLPNIANFLSDWTLLISFYWGPDHGWTVGNRWNTNNILTAHVQYRVFKPRSIICFVCLRISYAEQNYFLHSQMTQRGVRTTFLSYFRDCWKFSEIFITIMISLYLDHCQCWPSGSTFRWLCNCNCDCSAPSWRKWIIKGFVLTRQIPGKPFPLYVKHP